MQIKINNSWDILLCQEFNSNYFIKLTKQIAQEKEKYNILPKEADIFNSLKLTSYENTKVVILGQDPYHEINQAHGLSFSVLENTKFPPSLKNIFKELKNDLGIEIPTIGNLTKWAMQGVLLLNTVLTVREHEAGSHRNIGWEIFTDRIIKILNDKDDPIVFILWGNDAQKKISLITNSKHLVLTSAHPSPLSASRGFFDNHHFSKTNEFLKSVSKEPIDWTLE